MYDDAPDPDDAPPGNGPAPLVVAVLNHKGGVGKTTTVFHLGGALAKRGLRVLVADMDPQANLTAAFLGPRLTAELQPARTLAALFDDAADPESAWIVRPTAFAGLSLAPGSATLRSANVPEPESAGAYQWAMRTFLREAAAEHDVVLIDCPPNLGLCSWNALLAATHVLVPVQPEDFAAQGVPHVLEAVAAARAANPGLALAGYLLTLVRHLAVHDTYAQLLRDQYPADVFAAGVPDASDFKSAIATRRPVGFWKSCPAAAAVDAVAAELLARCGRAEVSETVPAMESV